MLLTCPQGLQAKIISSIGAGGENNGPWPDFIGKRDDTSLSWFFCFLSFPLSFGSRRGTDRRRLSLVFLEMAALFTACDQQTNCPGALLRPLPPIMKQVSANHVSLSGPFGHSEQYKWGAI